MIEFAGKIDWFKTGMLVAVLAGIGGGYWQFRSLENELMMLKAGNALRTPVSYSKNKAGDLVASVPVAQASSAKILKKIIQKDDRPILQRLKEHAAEAGSSASMIGEFNTSHHTDALLSSRAISCGSVSEYEDAFVKAQVFRRGGKKDSLHYEARDEKSIIIRKKGGEMIASITGKSPHDSTTDMAVFQKSEKKGLFEQLPLKEIGIGAAGYFILNFLINRAGG
ncbi:MAG: hypothetical protein HGA77_04955 [Chlorobiaceae bacterium]|nr:hypothetical protein [Chlorobiaceae bacterium]